MLAACSTPPADTHPNELPGPDEGTDLASGRERPTAIVAAQGWRRVDPQEVGLDEAVLDDLVAAAGQAETHCLVVVRDGVVAGEWAWGTDGHTTPQETWSVTKSVVALLVAALDADPEVDLDLDDPMSRWIEEWQQTPSEDVTIRHVLTGVSGREWSIEVDFEGLEAASDRTEYAIGLGQDHPPGEVWAYNNSAIQALERVLSQATGASLPSLLQERVLGPLGMEDSSLETDDAGNGLAFLGLQSTCRDLARIGLLVLDDGRWADQQVLPADAVAATTEPDQELNVAFGQLWWGNRRGPQPVVPITPTGEVDTAAADQDVLEPIPDRQLVPGAPEDLLWALGFGDQILQVHRPTGTVVVRLGSTSGGFGAGQTARVVTEAVLG